MLTARRKLHLRRACGSPTSVRRRGGILVARWPGLLVSVSVDRGAVVCPFDSEETAFLEQLGVPERVAAAGAEYDPLNPL